jgi:hypothetical protein
VIATAGAAGVAIYAACCVWSSKAALTINPAPPAISSITPSSVTAGGAGFILTLESGCRSRKLRVQSYPSSKNTELGTRLEFSRFLHSKCCIGLAIPLCGYTIAENHE